jgi:hypothetical protein
MIPLYRVENYLIKTLTELVQLAKIVYSQSSLPSLDHLCAML